MIFLIGMPASGKTYWSRKIDAHYNWMCVDLDDVIEEKAKKSIHLIFEEDGVDAFRELEHDSLKAVIEKHQKGNVVVACGGGTPAFFDNIDLMKKAGCVVYLKTEQKILRERLDADGDKRPLAPKAREADEILQKLYNERKEYYEQAHYTLSNEELTINDFDKIIESCTNQQ